MTDDVADFIDKMKKNGIRQPVQQRGLAESRATDRNGNNIKVAEAAKRTTVTPTTQQPVRAATQRPQQQPIRKITEAPVQRQQSFDNPSAPRRSYKNAPPALLDLFDKLIDFVEYNGTRVIGQLAGFLDQFEVNGVAENFNKIQNFATGPVKTITVPGMGDFQIQGTEQQRTQMLMEQAKAATTGNVAPAMINYSDAPPLEFDPSNIEKMISIENQTR